jgi:hypothetical protein
MHGGSQLKWYLLSKLAQAVSLVNRTGKITDSNLIWNTKNVWVSSVALAKCLDIATAMLVNTWIRRAFLLIVFLSRHMFRHSFAIFSSVQFVWLYSKTVIFYIYTCVIWNKAHRFSKNLPPQNSRRHMRHEARSILRTSSRCHREKLNLWRRRTVI